MTATIDGVFKVEARGIAVNYGTHRALDDVSCKMRDGSFVCLLGPDRKSVCRERVYSSV